MIEVAVNPDGGLTLHQSLVQPVVYLDHWAVRRFSADLPLQDRLIEALQRSGGTLLFSSLNLMEFVAMQSLEAAVACERLLARLLPAVYVADTVAQARFLLDAGAPNVQGSPEDHWMLHDLGLRMQVAGALTVTRFVQDAVIHRDLLLPLFNDMKATVAASIAAVAEAPPEHQVVRTFRPKPGMLLRDALFVELLREPVINGPGGVDLNDSMDIVHALSCAVASDFILLDNRWCHRLGVATKRLRKGGVTGHLARAFSPRSVAEFLGVLERIGGTRAQG